MKRAVLIGGALVVVGSGPALAADVAWSPRVGVMGVYNDNNRLTDVPGQEIEVAGAVIDAQITVLAETPRTNFSLTPRLRSSFYPGDQTEEADDQFVYLDWGHATERTRLRLGADYSRVVTFSSFYPEPQVSAGSSGGSQPFDPLDPGGASSSGDSLGDPDLGVGVGQSTGKNRQQRLAVRPEVRFDLSPRHAVEFRLDYVDVSYDEQVQGDREDFTSTRGTLGYRWTLSQTQNLLLRTSYGQYDPVDDDSRDGYGVDGRWSYNLSETAEAYARLGFNRVETQDEATGDSGWETGFTGGAGVRWTWEVTDLWLDASQFLNPDSSGDLVTRTEMRLQIGRRITEAVRVTAAGRVMQDTGATDADDFRDRTYAAGSLGFEWRWARQWLLRGSYDYRWREYDQAPTNAESNAFSLGVVWQPGRL